MNFRNITLSLLFSVLVSCAFAQSGFVPLFEKDLSNAIYPQGIWTYDSVLTASADQCIWTENIYDDFILDLEFKNSEGTNSGVIVHCNDIKNWIPNSVEIQIADDYSEEWANADKKWQCGAIFGHLEPRESMVKKPGEWNTMRIACKDNTIHVVLNGSLVAEMNLKLWKSAKINPDGSEIPSWLSTAKAELPTRGHIGFQGKHAGASVWFRNIQIKEL
jgi:hypothetical protein